MVSIKYIYYTLTLLGYRNPFFFWKFLLAMKLW